jgi:hypothetical protein
MINCFWSKDTEIHFKKSCRLLLSDLDWPLALASCTWQQPTSPCGCAWSCGKVAPSGCTPSTRRSREADPPPLSSPLPSNSRASPGPRPSEVIFLNFISTYGFRNKVYFKCVVLQLALHLCFACCITKWILSNFFQLLYSFWCIWQFTNSLKTLSMKIIIIHQLECNLFHKN